MTGTGASRPASRRRSGRAAGSTGEAVARRFTPDLLTEMFRNPLDAGYEQAARRRTERGPETPARRLAGRSALALVLLATGFLFALAYHQTVAAEPDSVRTHNGLVADVKSRQAETDELARQADDLRAQVNLAREKELAGAQTDQLRGLEAVAGVTRVRGGGVVIQLVDAPAPVDPVTGKPTGGTNKGKVLDWDLQTIANELWRDGAEAIAINEQRLTATSTIRIAGSTILVDFRPITSPYRIEAIGPGDLDRRFNNSQTGGMYRAIMTDYHMQVSVKKQGNLSLPAATDPQFHYAQPVTSQSASPSGSSGRRPPAGNSPAPSSSGGR